MKYILIFLFISTFCATISAQLVPINDIICGYDAAGNRIYRRQAMVPPNGIRMAAATTQAQAVVQDIRLYPNPCVKEMYIEIAQNLATSDNSAIVAEVYDLIGRKVKEQPLLQGINRIDVSELLAGTYPVIVRNEGKVLAAEKIVVSKE